MRQGSLKKECRHGNEWIESSLEEKDLGVKKKKKKKNNMTSDNVCLQPRKLVLSCVALKKKMWPIG